MLLNCISLLERVQVEKLLLKNRRYDIVTFHRGKSTAARRIAARDLVVKSKKNQEMPSRQESINLLDEYGQGAAWTRHCLPFLWSAALLHDIGRHVTHDPILHGVEGYKLLSKLAHEKEAHVCASHILYGLSAAEAVHVGLP
jgi:predicted hydrolase (HD superfamily)